MNHTALIQPAALQGLLSSAQIVVFDCSFDLTRPEAGRVLHAAGHVPGALYLHLDDDLSAVKSGRNGRHPLPDRQAFAARLAALGVSDDSQVVVYDAVGGMYAARAWWMLRWVGHAAVALLDGGLPAWKAAGLPLQTGAVAPREPGRFTLRPALATTVDRAAVLANVESAAALVVDARAPDRFRGENETLDPVGGHIPGACNRLFRDNLAADGRFKPAGQLRAEFDAATGGRAAAEQIHSCGSGVTACHNLLALEVAGLPGAALYPGSWSEWCAWPDGPIATGDA
ncbi:MAG: sulfurtransferase [Rubrivivax sp.]|nr:sulfurtransferase [Rubrivivax sp.]MBK7263492.1 sulfurtransferase [Rubrivivax sp.]